MAKKVATKKVATVRKTTKRYTAKVYITPSPEGGDGVNMGDKVSAKRAKEIAAVQGVAVSDLFK